ncbi:alpha/beta-hydrolase [Aulographum hederae CBS 113979]|uniref:Carboxylic ester hydrolase n=1 Tax=Aulographum hederae CBS 113979 TaxID=1176131 RepID=A0A6G1HDI7_9PEZI|nr:alpha/beta-hydrolase [Aulographum hederae CBS 113979]
MGLFPARIRHTGNFDILSFLFLLVLLLSELPITTAKPISLRSLLGRGGDFEGRSRKRQIGTATSTSRARKEVDLGYATYRGRENTTSGLIEFRGIRYARPPLGELRWQLPQPPEDDGVVEADRIPFQCPQAPNSDDGLEDLQIRIEEAGEIPMSEDCLFLSVTTPINATKLPVFFYIHGGGYGQGNADYDFTQFLNTNDNGFVAVAIQYRLGAFGFLSSDEVSRFGIPNAGLRDQLFALEWVQKHIHLFGGDPSRVTISGVSAGAGSVMLLDMAFGGTLGTRLFQNAIASSPYLPTQYPSSGFLPSQSYYAFAAAAGCPADAAYGNINDTTIFRCLVAQDSSTLIAASQNVTVSGNYGTWAFLPVTDGDVVRELPSRQLAERKVNARNMLVGNNAEEGLYFVPQNINSESRFQAWLNKTLPLLPASSPGRAALLTAYPYLGTSPRYATPGDSSYFSSPDPDSPPPIQPLPLPLIQTALSTSATASGHQQRANNLYAETTFVCPSYWLADAHTSPTGDSKAWKYQYSVPAALHGADIAATFGPASENQGPGFLRAFMRVWGGFVVRGVPGVGGEYWDGAGSADPRKLNPATDWPVWGAPLGSGGGFGAGGGGRHFMMLNLNQTGGEPKEKVEETVYGNVTYIENVGEGLRNRFRVVDAVAWEGGRGGRCEVWRGLGEVVPER